jgi:excisionase family DNA binding protein
VTTAYQDQRCLTVPETAALLRISESTAYRLAERNELPGARRLGGSIRVNREALEEWFAGSTVGGGSVVGSQEPALGRGSSVDAPAERDGTSGKREAVEPAQLAGER